MITIPNPCHMEIQTHRSKPYGVLRTTYRENGKSLHKNLARFTGYSLEQLRTMQAALQDKAVPKEELKIMSGREYGASHTCHAILKELELHKLIHSRPAQEWVKSTLICTVTTRWICFLQGRKRSRNLLRRSICKMELLCFMT